MSNDFEFDYLIIGCGLSGATFAERARADGKNVCILEKNSYIGGGLYQEKIEGITVHKYGPHIFHTNDSKVWEYITQFSDFIGFANQPVANVNGELYSLPFNMNTFHQMWGVKTPDEAKERIEADKVIYENPQNLKEYALATIGKTLYKLFIEKYTEKQWGKSCEDLPADFIKRLPLRFNFDNNYFNAKYQGVPVSYNEIIAKQTEKCVVYMNKDGKDYKCFPAKKVIYTGALDELYDYCYGELEWRSLWFETKVESTENYQGCAVMNFNGLEPYTRRTEHKHFLNEKSDKTVLTIEIPTKWEIGKERYYPIRNQRNIELYNKYLELAKKDGIYLLGRLGRYKYIDMDVAIKEAIELYESIETGDK